MPSPVCLAWWVKQGRRDTAREMGEAESERQKGTERKKERKRGEMANGIPRSWDGKAKQRSANNNGLNASTDTR